MEKQMVAHVRIPYSNKQEQAIDSLNDLADSQMLQTEWKEPVSKVYMLHLIPFTQHSGGDTSDGQQTSDCQGLEVNDFRRGLPGEEPSTHQSRWVCSTASWGPETPVVGATWSPPREPYIGEF